jgi:hypothetical protein
MAAKLQQDYRKEYERVADRREQICDEMQLIMQRCSIEDRVRP